MQVQWKTLQRKSVQKNKKGNKRNIYSLPQYKAFSWTDKKKLLDAKKQIALYLAYDPGQARGPHPHWLQCSSWPSSGWKKWLAWQIYPWHSSGWMSSHAIVDRLTWSMFAKWTSSSRTLSLISLRLIALFSKTMLIMVVSHLSVTFQLLLPLAGSLSVLWKVYTHTL